MLAGMEHENTHPGERMRSLIASVEAHLTRLKEDGVTTVEVDPDTVRAWSETASASPESPPQPIPEPAKGESPVSDPLDAIARRVASCQLCRLCETRNRTVPGQGAPNPDIMFIGEGPGADEDKQGLAFVGRAGQLLTKIITAMGYEREDVWIGNIVKCRPPNNRVPTPDEMAACMPYLKEQIALLKPKVIVCLGATAVKGLFDTQTGITKLRGQWMTFEEIDTMPTYHPAYLLRNPPAKRDVWEDMKEVLRKLGRPVPEKSKT